MIEPFHMSGIASPRALEVAELRAEIARLRIANEALRARTNQPCASSISNDSSSSGAPDRESARSPSLQPERNTSTVDLRSSTDGDRHNAFISNISHELRTPMHTLLGAIYLLADSSNLSQEQIDLIATITSSSNLLQSLILDLLDFSVVHSGPVVLSNTAARLLEVVEVVVPMCAFPALQKGVDLCYWVDPRCMLRERLFDSGRLEQVMLHLLSNAIKFTPRGGTVEMTVSRISSQAVARRNGELHFAKHNNNDEDDSEDVMLTVTDSGPGMAADCVQDLRLAYGRGRPRAHTDGLGVGLSIVWRLVEAMPHGSISCDSAPGRGTSMKVRLHAPPRGRTLVSESDPFDLHAEDRRVLAHAHILIITDARGSAETWRSLLCLYKARVHIANNLEAGERYAKEQRDLQQEQLGRSSAQRPDFPIDMVILDGYRDILARSRPKRPSGTIIMEQTTSPVDVEEISSFLRVELSALCRLLLVFVPSTSPIPSPNSHEHPVSLLLAVARLCGDRISCSMRPIRGEALLPSVVGCLRPFPPKDNRDNRADANGMTQNSEGRALLVAELGKPFNHRPFLCKVATQLQRLPFTDVQPEPKSAQGNVASSAPGGARGASSSPPAPRISVEPLSFSPAVDRPLTPHAAQVAFSSSSSSSVLFSPLTVNLSDLRVMVVDDSAVNRKLMLMFLRKLGCNNVLAAASGVECLQLLREQISRDADNMTQCILMDISMYPMDGRECTRHIRTELVFQQGRRPVYIVAQTANCTTQDRSSYTACGMDDFLPKPTSLKALTATLFRAQRYWYAEVPHSSSP